MPTELTLTLDDDGRFNIRGPIRNKLVALGLLEMGKEAICDFHKAEQQRVQPASPADFLALGVGKG